MAALMRSIASLGAEADEELQRQLDDAFGPARDGEDRFDALVGLLGIMKTLAESAPVPIPPDAEVHRYEGWIFGQAVPD